MQQLRQPQQSCVATKQQQLQMWLQQLVVTGEAIFYKDQ